MTTATPRTTSSKKKIVLYFIFEFFAAVQICSEHLSLSTLTQAKCVTPPLNSKLKYEKLAAAVHTLQITQNLVILRCCFEEDG